MWGETPDRFKTQEMCNKAVEKDSWALRFVPDHLKTQKMCDDAVWEEPFTLHFVPDWFVTQQELKTWDDYHGLCNNDDLLSGTMVIKNARPRKQK